MKHFYENIQGWFTFPRFYSSVVKNIPENGHIVEVGVWKGKSLSYLAVEIINSGKTIRLDGIDSFKGSREHLNKSSPFYESMLENDGLYDHFLSNIRPVRDYINVIRKESVDASKEYQDGSLDCVFLDGSHEYKDIKEDINVWYPKVRDKGLICGHDIAYPDVKKAVSEFFKEYMEPGEDVWVHVKKS